MGILSFIAGLTWNRNKQTYDQPVEGAITPDVACELDAHRIRRYAVPTENPYVAPQTNNDMRVGVKLDGILVNGNRYYPQFVPDDKYVKDKKGNPTEWQVYDKGFLMKDSEGVVTFYPNSIYKFDGKGQPILLTDEQKRGFQPVILTVYHFWDRNYEEDSTCSESSIHENHVARPLSGYNQKVLKGMEEIDFDEF